MKRNLNFAAGLLIAGIVACGGHRRRTPSLKASVSGISLKRAREGAAGFIPTALLRLFHS
jgi:hypothetical protein